MISEFNNRNQYMYLGVLKSEEPFTVILVKRVFELTDKSYQLI